MRNHFTQRRLRELTDAELHEAGYGRFESHDQAHVVVYFDRATEVAVSPDLLVDTPAAGSGEDGRTPMNERTPA